MTADPRAALTSLVAALERHLEVASSRRDPDDPAVVSAAEELTDAFFDYDEALFEATGVTTPLDGPYDEDDEDDDDEDEDDEADDRPPAKKSRKAAKKSKKSKKGKSKKKKSKRRAKKSRDSDD